MCVAALIDPPSVPPPNLFTPDFGQAPHMLVGRDALVDDLRKGLSAGPADSRFTTLLLGARGSGKTVMLNSVRDIASRSGWIVLPLDASTSGIHDRIAEYIEWAQDTHEDVPDIAGNAKEERSAVKFKLLPFEWQREAVQHVRPRWGLRRQLTTLADHAAQRDSSVLLLIDELHSGERGELRRLAADLQHIIKNENRHLAFVGAGLAEMKHTLLEDKKMTFFQRCNREDMPSISAVDAARFLAGTVSDAGGEFEGDALGILTEASGSLPFQMQLVGDYAWRIADAPMKPIDASAACVAAREAKRTIHERVALPTWHGLNETEQRYMRALSELGSNAHPSQIAHLVAGDPKTLARAETHLRNFGCITSGDDGTITIGDIINTEDMGIIIEQQSRYEISGAAAGTVSAPARSTSARPRCNAVMPRVQARCVLPKGHAGGHRSR